MQFDKKDFLDFHIPDDIQNHSNIAVEDYRTWFRDNYFLERYILNEITPSEIVFQYNVKFPPKYNISILNEDYKLVENIPNKQNYTLTSDFDFEKFTYEMAHLKKMYANVFSNKVLRILSKHDYLLNRSDYEISTKLATIFTPQFVSNYGINNVKEKLVTAKSIKFEIMKNLIEYFKWTYGLNEKDFNEVVLENFGLECCAFCKKNIK